MNLLYLVYVRNAGTSGGRYQQVHLHRTIGPQEYQQVVTGGFRYRSRLELPRGEYEIRILVRDRASGRIGTVSARVNVSATAATLNP